VHDVDGLQRADHDTELDDPAVLVDTDDVDAVTYVPAISVSNSSIAVSAEARCLT
jgi:hypothetical protein